jgi:rubrerythrin
MGSENPDSAADGGQAPIEETERPIGAPHEPAGEEYHLWRCSNCGEMGQLQDQLPAACPECGASREDLYYWEED